MSLYIFLPTTITYITRLYIYICCQIADPLSRGFLLSWLNLRPHTQAIWQWRPGEFANPWSSLSFSLLFHHHNLRHQLWQPCFCSLPTWWPSGIVRPWSPSSKSLIERRWWDGTVWNLNNNLHFKTSVNSSTSLNLSSHSLHLLLLLRSYETWTDQPHHLNLNGAMSDRVFLSLGSFWFVDGSSYLLRHIRFGGIETTAAGAWNHVGCIEWSWEYCSGRRTMNDDDPSASLFFLPSIPPPPFFQKIYIKIFRFRSFISRISPFSPKQTCASHLNMKKKTKKQKKQWKHIYIYRQKKKYIFYFTFFLTYALCLLMWQVTS